MKPARKTKAALQEESLTRSARKRLMHAVDILISNFEANSKKPRKSPTDSPRSAQLDRSYERLANVAAALSYWHSHPKYLSEDGEPIALAATGPLSIETLFNEAVGCENSSTADAQDLLHFGLVTRTRKRYLPNTRSAVVGKKSPLILAHATNAVGRLISTVSHNVSGKELPRYERQVAAVKINARELPQFLRFVEQQGQYFIDSIDDWLSARQLPTGSSQPSISVGVGAFAWTEGGTAKSSKVRKPSSATRPRR